MLPKPIAYCETNWIVALAFPHHQHHRFARDLLERASRGECEIRLPYAALLEARLPIVTEGKRISEAFAHLRDELANAVQNGHSHFAVVAAALQGDEMGRYLLRPVLDTVDKVEVDPAVVVLRDQTVACNAMGKLRPQLAFRGKDVVDLYILAAVIGDRDGGGEPDRPAVFFSTNRKEFEPKSERQAKLRTEFYEPHRIVWHDDFDLDPAVGDWNGRFVVAPVIKS
jgi:predicted nucleic acid-binding protein